MQDAQALVNQHFLRHLVTLPESEEVNASEDVFSDSGVKLISKGSRISQSMHERIVTHKLRKPLESSIQVGAPLRNKTLLDTLEVVLDASPALVQWISAKSSREGIRSQIKRVAVGEQLGSLLKLQHTRMSGTLHHAMLVLLLSIGMIKRLGMASDSLIDNMMVASLCHDIGDLYIDPNLYAERTSPLTPQEWRQMAAHPAVGHSVLKGLGGITPVVLDLVLEHHERLDGCGYPRGLRTEKVGREGHILAVAEMLSRFVGDCSEPFAQAEIALKIMPGEFRSEVVGAVAACREELRKAKLDLGVEPAPIKGPKADPERMAGLFMRIALSCDAIENLREPVQSADAGSQKLYGEIKNRFERITRAISSTGLDSAQMELASADPNDPEVAQIQLEFAVAVSEVSWRMQELSRFIVLQTAALPEAARMPWTNFADALVGARM